MKAPRNGPHNYWSEDVKPSRGQWQTIAELALELLDEQLPATRLGASLQIGTLRAALGERSQPSTVPTSKPSSKTNGASDTRPLARANGASATAASSAASDVSASSRARRTGVRTAATTPTEAGHE